MSFIAALALAPFLSAHPPKLVASWPGNGNFIDVVSGQPAKPMGAVVFEDAVDGKGFDFDGRSSVIFIQDSPRFKITDGLTLSAWVKVRTLPKNGNSPQAPIIFRGDDRDGLDPYVLAVSTSGSFTFGIEDAQNNAGSIDTPAALNQWVHLCATWDGDTGRMNLYLNGQLAQTGLTKVRPIKDLEFNAHPGVAIGNVQNPFGDRHFQPFDGMISQVKIYDGALTKSDFVKPKNVAD